MALTFIATSVLPIAAIVAAELFILPSKIPQFYESSKIDFLPKGFSLVIIVNVVVSAAIMVYLGLIVAGARTTSKAKAAKDGDKDAEERYSYPKLYAEGFSVHAKQFNCVQRGHQQALETYTAYVAMSLVGGIRFPVTVTLAGLLWSVARLSWASGYATGEPSKRYDGFTARGIWSSLIMLFFASLGTAAYITGLVSV